MKEENTQLGVFWGSEALYFVNGQQQSDNSQKFFKVLLQKESSQKVLDSTFSPEGMQILSNLQESLRQNNIASASINLSLPSKDIIFRSFVIPWMMASEIKSVVEFEASKYIPFALKELSYAYHAMPIQGSEIKRIRIIFVAIKKETLEKCTAVLEEASLNVKIVEPAPLSLIRCLLYTQHINPDQVIAVIGNRCDFGKIIIVDQATPLFVREFQINSPGGERPVVAGPPLFHRLTNEIRISLEYFNRQDPVLQVKDLLFLSSDESEDYISTIQNSFNMPVKFVNPSSVLAENKIADVDQINFINAYGASLIHEVDPKVSFDLSLQRLKTTKITAGSLKKKTNVRSVVQTAIISVIIILGSLSLSRFMNIKDTKQITLLKQQLGPHQSASTEKLKKTNQELLDKLNGFKSIRINSDVSFFLTTFPEMMPYGTWLENVNIVYLPPTKPGTKIKNNTKTNLMAESKLTIDITGLVYAEAPQERFKIINKLVSNIKNDQKYSKMFGDVSLENVKSQKYAGYNVTSFQLKLK